MNTPPRNIIFSAFSSRAYDQEINSTKLAYGVYPDVYHLCCSSFIPDIQSFKISFSRSVGDEFP